MSPFDDQITPTQGNLIHQGLNLYKSFFVEMEIFLARSNPSLPWKSLIHFTGGDFGSLLRVFFLPASNRIHVSFYRNRNVNFNCDSHDLPLGKWSKLIFAQYEENGKFYNKLTMNGSKLTCHDIMSNATPRTYENVEVREEMKTKK